MSNLPLVSVIIPTYQRVKQTLAAVDSVFAQDYPNFEVIVVDDGSSASVIGLLKAFLPANVILLTIPHSGLPAVARNAGVIEAKGDWVAFLDSDDLWTSNKLTAQIEAALKGNYDCLSGDFSVDVIQNFLGEGNVKTSNLRLFSLLRHNRIVNSSVIVRKSALEAVGGVSFTHNVRGVEDYATWLRLVSKFRWGHLNQIVGTYITESPESIRISNQSNPFNQLYALIDFIGWLRCEGKRLWLARFVLKLIPISLSQIK